jgi:hypothetical protein
LLARVSMLAWQVGSFGINLVAALWRHVFFHWIVKVGDLNDHVVKSWKMRLMKYPRWFCYLPGSGKLTN